MTERQNAQLVTCGIFYCRVSANLKGCGSLQTSSWLDSDVLRNRQQKHTAKPLVTIAAQIPNKEVKYSNCDELEPQLLLSLLSDSPPRRNLHCQEH